MRTYASSRVKKKSFYRKSELQMTDVFVVFRRPYILVHQNGAPIWRLHTKVRETFWQMTQKLWATKT